MKKIYNYEVKYKLMENIQINKIIDDTTKFNRRTYREKTVSCVDFFNNIDNNFKNIWNESPILKKHNTTPIPIPINKGIGPRQINLEQNFILE
jgi:hypothetical protein